MLFVFYGFFVDKEGIDRLLKHFINTYFLASFKTGFEYASTKKREEG